MRIKTNEFKPYQFKQVHSVQNMGQKIEMPQLKPVKTMKKEDLPKMHIRKRAFMGRNEILPKQLSPLRVRD